MCLNDNTKIKKLYVTRNIIPVAENNAHICDAETKSEHIIIFVLKNFRYYRTVVCFKMYIVVGPLYACM
jgi:hypothetical protein